MIDLPRSNRGVGKDVLALRELRADLLAEVSEPLLSLAVTLVHGGEVLYIQAECDQPRPNRKRESRTRTS